MGLGRWAVSLALGVVVGAAGCAVGGSSTGTVTGKVTYKGGPVKGGNVYFFVDDKNPGVGEIQEDGTYKAERVPVGNAKVSVDTESMKPPMGMPAAAAKKYTAPPPDPKVKTEAYVPPDPGERAKRYVKIPEKYIDPERSGLTYTVKTGSQEFNIEISDR
jgi:hypothetical protein